MTDDFTGPHCPTCGTGAGGLRVLADLLDQAYSDNSNNEAQNDMRKWAREINKAVKQKEIQERINELLSQLDQSTEGAAKKKEELTTLLLKGFSL